MEGKWEHNAPILDSGPFVPSVPNTDESSTEDGVEQGEGKTNAMHRQHPIALVIRTVHLDVVVAPLLNQLDRHRCFHKPGEHRIDQEYHLRISNNRIVSFGGLPFGLLVGPTANPIRVAMDELQLHDLQNIDAIRGVQRTKRCTSWFVEYLR